jgi:hypothetical protein
MYFIPRHLSDDGTYRVAVVNSYDRKPKGIVRGWPATAQPGATEGRAERGWARSSGVDRNPQLWTSAARTET